MPDSSDPSFSSGTPSNSGEEKLTNETEKLRNGFKELTDVLKDKKQSEESSSDKSDKTNLKILECLQDMRGHLQALYILQKESSVSSAENTRSTEVDLDDPSSAAAASPAQSPTPPPPPSVPAAAVAGNSSSFVNAAKGIFYIAAAIGALAIGLKLMKGIGLGEMVKSFLLIAAIGTGLLVFSALGNGENMKKLASSLIILAVGISALAVSLLVFGSVGWGAIFKAGVALGMLGITFGLFSAIFNAKKIESMTISLMFLSVALVSLAAGLTFFSGVSWGAILKGTFALGLLVMTLGIMSWIFNPQKIIMMSASMIVLGAGLVSLGYGLTFFSKVSFGSIIKGTFALGLLVITLGIMSWIFNPMSMGKIALSLIVLSAALVTLSYGLGMIAKVSWGSIFKATIMLGLLGITLGVISWIMNGDKAIKLSIAFILFGVALAAMAKGLMVMAGANWGSIFKATTALIFLGTTFGIISLLFGGDRMVKAGLGMLVFSVALIAFAGALVLMNSVNWSSLVKMFIAIVFLIIPFSIAVGFFAAASLVFSAAMLVASIAMWTLSKTLSKLVGVFWDFGTTLLLVSFSFYMLGKSIAGLSSQWLDLLVAGAVLAGFGLIILGLNYLFKKAGVSNEVGKLGRSFLAFSIGLYALSFGMSALEKIGWETIGKAAAILVGFAVVSKILGSNSGAMIKGSIGLILLGAGLISFSYGIKVFGPIAWETIKGVAGAITVVGAASMLVGMRFTDIAKGSAAMAILSVGLVALGVGLSLFAEIPFQSVVTAASGIALVGTASAILGIFAGNVLLGALAMVAIGLALIPLAIGLDMMKDVGMDTIGVLAVGLLTLGVAGALFGLGAEFIIPGAAAIALLGGALWVAGWGLEMFVKPFDTFIDQLVRLGEECVNILAASAALAILGLSLIPFAIGLGLVGLALLVVAAALWFAGDKFVIFNDLVKITFEGIGMIFDKVSSIIKTTGDVIVSIIDKVSSIASPSMAGNLVLVAGGITAVAGAIALLMGAGAVSAVASGVGSAVGGMLQGIGNWATGNKGGTLDAAQTLGLLIEAGKSAGQIGILASSIDLLTAALIRFSAIPPIKIGSFSELFSTIGKMKDLEIKASATTNVNGSVNSIPSSVSYTGTGIGSEGQLELLQDILSELKNNKNTGTIINQSNTTASSTSVSGGGGGGVQIIPMSSSSNRDSTWRMTQGSVRPAG